MVHLIDEVPLQAGDDLYHMVVEIPSGTNDKWQTDARTGAQYWDTVNGQPRVIRFLSYPFNYGCFPQTVLAKEKGGDGDPLDCVLLAPAQPRGAVVPVRVIGAIHLSERGETDTKILAVLPDGFFSGIRDLPQMQAEVPGAVELARTWFEFYKGPGAFTFSGYADRSQAVDLIERYFAEWRAEKQKATPP